MKNNHILHLFMTSNSEQNSSRSPHLVNAIIKMQQIAFEITKRAVLLYLKNILGMDVDLRT